MARPLRIEFPILGLSHAGTYTHRNRPGRRFARCHDQLHHHALEKILSSKMGSRSGWEQRRMSPLL